MSYLLFLQVMDPFITTICDILGLLIHFSDCNIPVGLSIMEQCQKYGRKSAAYAIIGNETLVYSDGLFRFVYFISCFFLPG